MRETPRPRETAADSGPGLPQRRPGRAFAHTGASGSGTPHRSDGRPPHTPRGARRTDLAGHPGTPPPVPGWPAPLVSGYVSGLLGLLAVLFALITWQVVVEGPLLRLDERVGPKLFGRGPAGLTQVLSDLGGMAVALPVLTVVIAYALWRRALRLAVYAALTMAAVPALVIPLKVATARQGPLTEAVNYYPSGHTATAAVAYGASALVLLALPRPAWLRAASWPRTWMMPVAAILLTTATGIGLVLHGYHWPLDVLASWCLGPLVLAPLWWVSCRSSRRSSG
ncbi:phosphatase PAP2 family protein [Streptomyces sp. MW-W600-10]|uniref:phosphatase PAP2 family protein n=1 Tax=Streptomyces sp. MW-W600-10 TaxID=2829819 RepID=UPI001C487045|nr:phosphatase PAP2 family protein [Streptomyces sp. MW-W600-10]MBV7243897.1 phosphatase PAP2 family protein [Streptomyces sp. MW-W600-10]